MKMLRLFKDLIDWGSTIWTVIGALGFASAVAGFAITIGGSIWAVMTGIPLPVALMMGFCTFVMTLYLAMAPMMYRALVQARPPQATKAKVTPNYTVWRHMQSFTLYQASMLWCDREPKASSPNHESETWLEVLKDAVRSGKIGTRTNSPFDTTRVTRASLKAFAKAHGYDPQFLREE
jgi:hypothetical protein